MKKITMKNENRALLINYLKAKANKKIADAAEKAAKAAAKTVLVELASEYKQAGATDYAYATVQVEKQAKAVVYKETTVSGTIDWQAYAMALGGTIDGAEQYRKAATTRTTIEWATDKQAQELGL